MIEQNKIDDIEKYFIERTRKHIKLVRKYLKKIRDNHPICIDREIIEEEIITHDLSKFEEPEHMPYLWTTIKYRDNLPNSFFTEEQQLLMQQATEHHVKVNKHHPEYWTLQMTNLINFIDRDKPKRLIIDATKMPDSYIACMVADWMAVAEERGTNPFNWANSNINIRWKFTKFQEELIYKILETHWRVGFKPKESLDVVITCPSGVKIINIKEQPNGEYMRYFADIVAPNGDIIRKSFKFILKNQYEIHDEIENYIQGLPSMEKNDLEKKGVFFSTETTPIKEQKEVKTNEEEEK